MIKSLNAFQNSNKGKNKLSQTKTVFEYLQQNIATNSMISAITGISRPNICRIKRQLEKMELLWIVKKGKCQITNHRAGYLTTNPAQASYNYDKAQLKLF